MPELPETRQSLLIRLQTEVNDSAWSEFVTIYEQAIYSHARRRGLQDADAWDVTQEVLEAVEKKVVDWQPDSDRGTFRGWLFRVARNIAIDKIKAQSRRVAASGDTRVARALDEVPATDENESTQFWNDYRKKLFLWAAEQVKPDYQNATWEAFWQTAVKGVKAEDVAEQLGMAVGSVYAAKFRIVKRIREVTSRFDDPCDDSSMIGETNSN